jgi:hypothetical protein
MRLKTSAANPLARVALDTPAWVAQALSIGGRVTGAGVALYVFGDEAYDRTQMVAAIIALVPVLSLVPLRGVAGAALPALAAGLLFFCGAAFAGETPVAGASMLVAGVAAAAGTMMASHRGGRPAWLALGGFFAAMPALVACVAAVALLVEG